ncbi:MAG TPA: hypothetical protein VFZ34_10365 [Blastocatellia bacterium]|nr:hypothetical protein [Blastocatellia bacterium]
MRFLSFALLIALFALTLHAQPLIVVNSDKSVSSAGTKYHYLFENEKFTTPRIELEFGGDGKGEFRFKKKDSEEIANKLQVTPTVLEQINALLTELSFLDSSENYQHKKDFSHLGTVTIEVAKAGKHRKTQFNYTDNPAMTKLANIFRNIATQETRVFEIETVRQSDPISTPAQLRFLDNELRSKSIADPERFVALLQDIKMDEGVPLIARNHAERLLKDIKKAK